MAKTKKKPERILQVSSHEDAKKLIELQYKQDKEADYIVLENAAVFNAENKSLARKYARKFKWKLFEVTV